jgi:hypothetical protein
MDLPEMIADKLKALRVPGRHAFGDLLFLTGIALVAFGIWTIYPPAAFIFGGLAVGYVALLVGRD